MHNEDNFPRIDGAQLLDRVRETLTTYVVFPSDETADAVTLWVAATHAQPAWEHATRLVPKSPQKRCGKSRLLEILAELAHRPLRTTNISVAALVRSISDVDPPTLFLDEADAIFGRNASGETNEALRGIMNTGFARGWPYVRWDINARALEESPTFCMAALAGIGDFPDTIEDRAVVIQLQRRGPGQTVRAFRRKHAKELERLQQELHVWVRGIADQLREAEPDLPVEDRAADVWEPLIAVADAAGGDWPERARLACKSLTGEDDEDVNASITLLRDLRDIFSRYPEHVGMFTRDILAQLKALEGAPYAAWNITDRWLARRLKGYGIKSKKLSHPDNGNPAKGYLRESFLPVWATYVPEEVAV